MTNCSHGKSVWDHCGQCEAKRGTGWPTSKHDEWVDEARRCQRSRTVACRNGGRCGGHEGTCWGPRPEGE